VTTCLIYVKYAIIVIIKIFESAKLNLDYLVIVPHQQLYKLGDVGLVLNEQSTS